MSKGKSYTTREGRVHVRRVNGSRVITDSKGNILRVKSGR